MSDNPWAPQPSANEPSDLTVPRGSLGTTPPRPAATVQLDDGTTETIEAYTLLGRDPVPDAGVRARLLKLDDPQKGVSKTHLAVDLVDGALAARDTGSTNQTAVLRHGAQLPVPVGTWTPLTTGDVVVLGGTRRFTVTSAPAGAPADDRTVARHRAPAAAPAVAPDPTPIAAAPTPPPAAPTAAPSADRCPVCGDVLDPAARFCVVCGTPIGSASPGGPSIVADPASVGPAGPSRSVNPRVPLLIGAGVVLALVLGFLGFRLLSGGDDSVAGSAIGAQRVPSAEPSRRYEFDGDGLVRDVAGAPGSAYVLRSRSSGAAGATTRLDVVALDGAGAERWSERVDGDEGMVEIVDGVVIAITYSWAESGSLLTAFDANGEKLWEKRTDGAIVRAGRLYEAPSSSRLALLNPRNRERIEDVRGDDIITTRDGLLVVDDDGTQVSAYSFDLRPLIEDVEIDDDERPVGYQSGAVVVMKDDKLIGYGTDGQRWSTRVRVGDLSSAVHVGGDRWLLGSVDGEYALESGIGDKQSTEIWTEDGYAADLTADGNVIVVYFRDRNDDAALLMSATADEEFGEFSGSSIYLQQTSGSIAWLDRTSDGGELIVTDRTGKHLWEADADATVLDGGVAVVDNNFDRESFTLEIFG